MPNKKNNPKKTEEELKFEQELKKLKLSAEHGATFANEKKKEIHSETDEGFLARMKELEEAMRNPMSIEIRQLLGFPKFPAVEDLTDEELSTAIELVNIALANENIVLDTLYPTPERDIYRFLTEELMKHEAGMAGAGGTTMHFIYEEFYPNHPNEIKSDVTQFLHFICHGHRGYLPWRIASEVKFHGKRLSKEGFEELLDDHCNFFKGMSFIGVDSIESSIDEEKAYVKATFQYYLDQSSGAPGEKSAEAEFYFELYDNSFLLNHLVIERLGIR